MLIEQHAVTECEHHGHRAIAPIPTHGTEPGKKLGGTRSRAPRPRPVSPPWKRSCDQSEIPARTADARLHFPARPPIFHLLSNGGVFVHGPACQLEGLFAAFARDLPDRIVSRDLGIRENQLQPDQQEDRPRIRYLKVDADTGEEVSNEDIIKGYQIDKDRYLEVTKESSKTSRSNPPAPSRLTSLCRAPRSTIFTSSAPIHRSRWQGRP